MTTRQLLEQAVRKALEDFDIGNYRAEGAFDEAVKKVVDAVAALSAQPDAQPSSSEDDGQGGGE